MKSEVIQAVLKDELDRNQRLILRYEKEIENLPKGSIFRRKMGNQEYLYLNYRDGKKVISKFLGKPDSFNTEELVFQLNKRKEYVQLVKKLKIEQAELKKALK
jgi:hypothetical protein